MPWCGERPGLLGHRRTEAELIGAGRGDELVEVGELRLPAELADAAADMTNPAHRHRGALALQFVHGLAHAAIAGVAEDGAVRNEIDPPRSEERRGLDRLGVDRVEVRDD